MFDNRQARTLRLYQSRIATRYHANQITQWKNQRQERASTVFATAAERSESAGPDVKELHAKIGQLAMENDFLAAALGRISGASAKR